MKPISVAIAGNPNCGKTTLFNALTGSRQRVGNWPGVTVERLEGRYSHAGRVVTLVDLPGIYSFSAYSPDERVSREYILHDRPDVVVNVLDATNLERNLYLTTMLLDMQVPMVVVLNMIDLAKMRHLRIEVEHLARHLDCPVIPVTASKGLGIAELREAIQRVAESRHIPAARVVYNTVVETVIGRLQPHVTPAAHAAHVDPRWLAIKLIEEDQIAATITDEAHGQRVISELEYIHRHTGDPADIVVADGRYGFIRGLVRDVLHRDLELRRTVTDLIDRVILNRLLGIPLFFAVMYAVFYITVNIGSPFIDFFDRLCGTIFVDGVRHVLERVQMPDVLVAFVADGIGQGVQTISTFIPPIFLIFLCLSFLEDSGYMARAAFVMDRLLRVIGLPGKAFLPMLVGFGCNVPGILATRTLENERDRRLAMLMNPFMSCGARLPVYTMFAVIFFPQHGGQLIFGLYMTGIVLAVLTGLLLKRTLLPGEPGTFVMELPPYHMPTLNGILFHTWHRLKGFIVRAGRVILAVVILTSAIGALDVALHKGVQGADEDRTQTGLLARTGRLITPVFAPMGVRQDNWPATVGLIAGVFAKEAVAGTLDSLYRREVAEEDAEFSFRAEIVDAFLAVPQGFAALFGVDEESLDDQGTQGVIREAFGSSAAVIAYLLFILLYCPCVAVIGAIYQESDLKWTVFSVAYLTVLAWVVATLFYQLAVFVQQPIVSSAWVTGGVAFLVAGGLGLRTYGRRNA